MKHTTTPLRATLFAVFAALSGALVASCGVGEASSDKVTDAQESAAVPVEVVTPVRSDIHATYLASATIASDADAPVVAKVAGEVVELLVEEGDFVKTGEILARLDGKRLRLEMLSAKANLERTQKEYERNIDLHQRGLISAAMFEGLKFDLAALEASYDLKRLNYNYSNIRAPISGIVSAREIKPGQNLAVGTVAYRITDTSELLAHLQVPQSELPKFSVGHPAALHVASMPDARFPATIIRISPTIDARNGTFRATARIDNPEGYLAPGMFGRFSISYETHENALVIPRLALLDEDDETTVYVVKDNQVLRRAIEVGFVEGDNVEVLSGLSEQDQIVVVGQTGLRDGSKVLANLSEEGSFTG